jgi:hypothetical protein
MLKTKLGVCVLAAGLLAGCGGGGGDAEAVATVPLSVANYETVALTVAASVVGSGNIISDAFEDTASADLAGSTTAQARALNSGRVANIARFSFNRLAVRQQGLERPAVAWTEIEPCTLSGYLSIRINDADNDGYESVGDSVTVTANQCQVEAGEPAVNGSLGYRITDLRYDALGYFVAGAFEMSFTNFTSAGLVLNGSASVSMNSAEFVISYKNLSTSYQGQTLIQNYTFRENAARGDIAIEGQYSINGSTYILSTPAAIRLGSFYPNSGTLRITDGRGARVDMSISSTGFNADLYLPGDTTLDASRFYAWSAL